MSVICLTLTDRRVPEAGFGADDEAAAVLVEVGKLEFRARCVVVRRHVHGEVFRQLPSREALQICCNRNFLGACIYCAPVCRDARLNACSSYAKNFAHNFCHNRPWDRPHLIEMLLVANIIQVGQNLCSLTLG